MSEPDAVVYLIRHGRTELNAAGVLRGRLDPPLDEVGVTEAAALAEAFRTVRLAAVVASPLQRARQTAAAIVDATGAALTLDGRIIDRDYGPWAGVCRDDVERRFGTVDAGPGVEPADVFAARTLTAVRAIAAQWGRLPVAVVAHDAVNRHILAGLVAALGWPDAIGQRTGCWNRLERRPSGWAAPIVDAVPHDGRRP